VNSVMNFQVPQTFEVWLAVDPLTSQGLCPNKSVRTVATCPNQKFTFIPIRSKVQCVPLATEPSISLIILRLMRILQRNLKWTTDTFLFISHTANVLLFKFHCNIFIGVTIIKEMPGLVASGTHCRIPRPLNVYVYTCVQHEVTFPVGIFLTHTHTQRFFRIMTTLQQTSELIYQMQLCLLRIQIYTSASCEEKPRINVLNDPQT